MHIQLPAQDNQYKWSYKTLSISIIVVLAVVRIVAGLSMELGTDEAYYWLYSTDIKWNYFDHPPLVGIWIRFFTANLLLQDYEIFIRLGSITACTVASWFMYKTCTVLHSARAGFIAVCLYSCSFFAAITAGLFMMPDAPQMFFYTACLWLIALVTRDESKWVNWMLLGIASGLCIMSKVHGVFIWVGIGLYILLLKRSWLSKPQLYVSIAIAFVICLPILLWNIENEFVSYTFHSSRVVANDEPIKLMSFASELINQLLYNNPINVVAIIIGIIAYKKSRMLQMQALSIYNFIGLPLAGIFLLVALFRDTTLPHWSGPAYVALLPLASITLASAHTRKVPILVWLSVGGFASFMLVWMGFIHFYPGTLGPRKELKFAKAEMLLQDALKVFSGFEKIQLKAEPIQDGWRNAGKQFNSIYQQELKAGKRQDAAPVVCYKWWGAHVEYYFCRPFGIPMIGLGNMDELHEYVWNNTKLQPSVNCNTAYSIVAFDDSYDVKERYAKYYTNIDSIALIVVPRVDRPAHKFYVYRLTGWQHNLPVIKANQ